MAACGGQRISAAHEENITGTFVAYKACCYIGDGEGADRFCGAPAVRGSAYCALHRALCQVAPGSPEGIAIRGEMAREAARPPAPDIAPILEREMLEPVAPEEAAQSIDLPRGCDPEDAP